MLFINTLEVVLLLFLGILATLQASFAILEKKAIFFFFPFVLLGILYCFQAGFLFYGYVRFLPILEITATTFLSLFYLYFLGGLMIHGSK